MADRRAPRRRGEKRAWHCGRIIWKNDTLTFQIIRTYIWDYRGVKNTSILTLFDVLELMAAKCLSTWRECKDWDAGLGAGDARASPLFRGVAWLRDRDRHWRSPSRQNIKVLVTQRLSASSQYNPTPFCHQYRARRISSQFLREPYIIDF